MRFVRKPHQNNIVSDDIFIKRKDNVDDLEPETFDNVIVFRLNTDDYNMEVVEGDTNQVEEIIETQNYFTIRHRTGKTACIKYGEVKTFEFEQL